MLPRISKKGLDSSFKVVNARILLISGVNVNIIIILFFKSFPNKENNLFNIDFVRECDLVSFPLKIMQIE